MKHYSYTGNSCLYIVSIFFNWLDLTAENGIQNLNKALKAQRDVYIKLNKHYKNKANGK